MLTLAAYRLETPVLSEEELEKCWESLTGVANKWVIPPKKAGSEK